MVVVNEEELAMCVKQYPVLFDKSHEEFHRKDIKKKTWEIVANKVAGLENGAEAEKTFQRIRDKYSRALKFIKESEVVADVKKQTEAAKMKVDSLKYMHFLEEFILPRRPRTNRKRDDLLNSANDENDSPSMLTAVQVKLPSMLTTHENSNQTAASSNDQLLNQQSLRKLRPTTSDLTINKTIETNFHGVEVEKEEEEEEEKEEKEEKSESRSNAIIPQTFEKKIQRKRSTTATTTTSTPDHFELFGQYIASKMRKLNESLPEEAMEIVEFNITSVLMRARSQTLDGSYVL